MGQNNSIWHLFLQRPPELELERRLWHCFFGLLVLLFYSLHLTHQLYLVILSTAVLLYGLLDYNRFSSDRLNQWFTTFPPQNRILRRDERDTRMTSTFWVLLATLICVAIFSKPIAALSLFYLAWCDPMAGTVGRLYSMKYGGNGRVTRSSARRSRGKTLAGSGAACLVAIIITFVYLIISTPPSTASHLTFTSYIVKLGVTCFMGGLIAAFSEYFTLGQWDDNLTMPIMSGILLSIFTPISSLYPLPI